jgi:hypothetical protein
MGFKMTETVTIDAVTYTTYTTLAYANEYMNAKFGEVGDAWRSADTSTKSRSLATTYRNLQTLPWVSGYETNAAWQAAISPASIEYASALIEGTFFEQSAQHNSGVKRLEADTAKIEYFKSFKSQGISSVIPQAAFVLLTPFLTGTGRLVGAYASGTDASSSFSEWYGLSIP